MYSISKGTYGTCVPVQHGPVDATSARLRGPRSTRRTRTCTNGGEVLVCALVKILVYVRWLRVLRVWAMASIDEHRRRVMLVRACVGTTIEAELYLLAQAR